MSYPDYGPRKIIHCDMDAFYASVEILDDPSLAGLPIVVGGSPDSRSVVTTASYEARKFGIRSAMACSIAKRLCPQALFIKPKFHRYVEISKVIRSIFNQYTDIVEPLSLDEAFLDVTETLGGRYASQLAKELQGRILNEIGISCSLGVAPNKLVAKIASDQRKPFGLTVVPPDQVLGFMENLPLRKIHGVGPVTEKKLTLIGFNVCSDLFRQPKENIKKRLPLNCHWLLKASMGLDDRPVNPIRTRKSFGKEDTFESDVSDIQVLSDKLTKLSNALCSPDKILDKFGRTITLKVKYANFKQITRSITLHDPPKSSHDIAETCLKLLMEKTEAGRVPIRLLGVSVKHDSQVDCS